jgi:hypothetical protein
VPLIANDTVRTRCELTVTLDALLIATVTERKRAGVSVIALVLSIASETLRTRTGLMATVEVEEMATFTGTAPKNSFTKGVVSVNRLGLTSALNVKRSSTSGPVNVVMVG